MSCILPKAPALNPAFPLFRYLNKVRIRNRGRMPGSPGRLARFLGCLSFLPSSSFLLCCLPLATFLWAWSFLDDDAVRVFFFILCILFILFISLF
ncbi:hypothetical protein B0T24DRAFT_609372 [Lasiosphaeria ovina]|uniref:Transmembrane protein n=1 Tax=Lasiosphaeria ovina TaxID=92902 RepID=A0AAE0TZ20_9PEZI|nr:hypothetical protein B0T24DRAFT_609372 [Lasiosphaeria ovina]